VRCDAGRIILHSLQKKRLRHRKFALLVVRATDGERFIGKTRQAGAYEDAQRSQQWHGGSAGRYRKDIQNEVQHFCAS